jgi:tetratricopeptide (TPR) repeat protein
MNVVAGLIMIILLPAFPQLEARASLNQGVAAFRKADYKSAVEYFKQALELDPNFATAEIYLATAYAQQYVPGSTSRENLEMADNAIESFSRVLRRDPDNLNALSGLASLYQNTNDLRSAHDTYIRVLTLAPQNPVAFYAAGAVDWLMVYQKQSPLAMGEQSRLIDEGLDYMDRAIALNPQYDDAMTYKNLLLREKARLAVDPAERARLIALADDWFNHALEVRKRNAELRRAGVPLNGVNVIPAPPPPPPRQ